MIAFQSQSRDDGDARGRRERRMAETLALIDIRDVHLDGREVRAQQCVAQRHAGMRERAAIDDEAVVFGVRNRGDAMADTVVTLPSLTV